MPFFLIFHLSPFVFYLPIASKQYLPDAALHIHTTTHKQQVPASTGRASRSPSVGSRSAATRGANASSAAGGACQIPHTFSLHTYTRPTVCQLCKKLLCGFFKQGVQCRDCHYNAHKKCVDEVPKNCTVIDLTTGAEANTHHCHPSGHHSNHSGNSPCGDRFYSEEFDDSDDTDEGGSCGGGGSATSTHSSSNSNHQQHMQMMTPTAKRINGGNEEDDVSTHHRMPSSASVPAVSTSTYYDLDDSNSADGAAGTSSSNSPPSRPTVCHAPSANIPLMRIVQSVKHTKRRTADQHPVIKEGWLVHFTNKDKLVRRHYWRVDTASITLYVSESSSKYFREIQLSDILAVDTARNLTGNESHCFQIRTANLDFFVGQDPLLTYRVGESLILPPPDSGIGAHLAKSWETAIRQALMPVTSTECKISEATNI